jgi:hypothetical protein
MFAAAVDDPRFSARRRVSSSYDLPAPVGGLNARDAYTDMDEQDAVILTNVFPEANYLTVRNGYVESVTGMTDPLRSLLTWNGLTGVDKLFAGAGADIWDVNADPATSVVSGLTNVDFQWTNIKTPGGMYLIYVNGEDPMGAYDGTTWTEPVISVATSSTFANVMQFKERLWFSVKNSLDTYYLGLQSIAGAASLFPLGSIFHKGGYVIGIGSFSNDAGEGPDDYLCFITNNGEVAVYVGTDPDSASTFALVGRFNVGMPIGRRCTVRVNGDLGIITQDGIVSMQAALRFSRESIQKATVTGKIQTLFSQYSQSYRQNFGWAPCIYPKARYLIINIPQIEDETQIQLVMNTITGAWCQFDDMDGGCWGVANDQLYFGGNNGTLYQADTGFLDDLTGNIEWSVQTSWQLLGRGVGEMFFTMVKPTMLVGTGVEFGINVNVDFTHVHPDISLQALAPLDSTMQWPWVWPGTWGGQTILDNRWQSTGAIGSWASVHLHGTVRDGPCQINAFVVLAERGGIL